MIRKQNLHVARTEANINRILVRQVTEYKPHVMTNNGVPLIWAFKMRSITEYNTN